MQVILKKVNDADFSTIVSLSTREKKSAGISRDIDGIKY